MTTGLAGLDWDTWASSAWSSCGLMLTTLAMVVGCGTPGGVGRADEAGVLIIVGVAEADEG